MCIPSKEYQWQPGLASAHGLLGSRHPFAALLSTKHSSRLLLSSHIPVSLSAEPGANHEIYSPFVISPCESRATRGGIFSRNRHAPSKMILPTLFASYFGQLFDPFRSQAVWKAAGHSNNAAIVDLGYAIYQGLPVQESRVNQFLGMRYAAAPLGDLRFRAPQPPKKEHGIQDATEVSPVDQSGGRSLTRPSCDLSVLVLVKV